MSNKKEHSRFPSPESSWLLALLYRVRISHTSFILRPTSCKIGPGFVQSENSNFLWVDRYKVAISKQLKGKIMHPNMVQTRAESASMVRIYGVKGVILALRSYEMNANKL